MMNRVLTSFNTFALILLFLSFVFSVFSIKTLKVNNTQSMKVNFFELSEITETQKRLPRAKPIEKIKEAGLIKTKEINQLEASLDIEKYKISKPDIKKELSKIKLSKERTEILKISSITALPTDIAKGFPPKVDPCVPGVIAAATFLFIKTAPIGNPPPIPLAIGTISGKLLDFSKAKKSPDLEIPH